MQVKAFCTDDLDTMYANYKSLLDLKTKNIETNLKASLSMIEQSINELSQKIELFDKRLKSLEMNFMKIQEQNVQESMKALEEKMVGQLTDFADKTAQMENYFMNLFQQKGNIIQQLSTGVTQLIESSQDDEKTTTIEEQSKYIYSIIFLEENLHESFRSAIRVAKGSKDVGKPSGSFAGFEAKHSVNNRCKANFL